MRFDVQRSVTSFARNTASNVFALASSTVCLNKHTIHGRANKELATILLYRKINDISLDTINFVIVVLAINNKISNIFKNYKIARRNKANKQQIKEFAVLDIV